MDIEGLRQEIFEAFKGVTRDDGVSLHETPLIDLYGTKQDRELARKKDTDTDWSEVKDEWIEENCGAKFPRDVTHSIFRIGEKCGVMFYFRQRKDAFTFALHWL